MNTDWLFMKQDSEREEAIIILLNTMLAMILERSFKSVAVAFRDCQLTNGGRMPQWLLSLNKKVGLLSNQTSFTGLVRTHAVI